MPENGSRYRDRELREQGDPNGVPWFAIAVILIILGLALGFALPWDWLLGNVPTIVVK